MPSSRSYYRFRLFSLILGAIIGASFASVQSLSQTADPEGNARKRITGYFDAWRRGDFEAITDYVHPDSRKVYLFRIKRPGAITGYKIDKIVFNAAKTVCEVSASVVQPSPMVPANVGEIPYMPITNQWVIGSDGEWYLLVPFNGDGLEKQFLSSGAMNPPATPAAGDTKPAAPAAAIFQPDPANPVSLHRGEKGVFRFSYRNAGTAPMKIRSAYADCECALVPSEFPLLAPGESGTLEFVFNTFGLPLGPLQKSVRVALSDQSTLAVIDLNVNNLPNFRVAPESVDFGTLKKGSLAEKTVQIVNESGRKIKVIATSKSERRLTILTDKAELGPGDTLNLTLRCNSSVPGEFMDILILRIDLDAEPLLNIPVRGKIIS
jgi:hypothetical protein